VPGQDGDVITSFGWSGHSVSDPPDFVATDDALGNIMGNLNSACIMLRISYRLGGDDPEDVVVERTVDFPGLGGGDMMPPNNCFLLKKTTLLGGRRHRGRNYLPGVSEGAVTDGGSVDVAVANGINTNVASMRSDMSTAGCELVLLHQSAPFTPTPVSEALCEAVIATQRRRLARS